MFEICKFIFYFCFFVYGIIYFGCLILNFEWFGFVDIEVFMIFDEYVIIIDKLFLRMVYLLILD